MARDVSVTAKCQKPDEVANEQDDPCDGDASARFSERYLAIPDGESQAEASGHRVPIDPYCPAHHPLTCTWWDDLSVSQVVSVSTDALFGLECNDACGREKSLTGNAMMPAGCGTQVSWLWRRSYRHVEVDRAQRLDSWDRRDRARRGRGRLVDGTTNRR